METSQKTIDVDSDKGTPMNEESVNQVESLIVGENKNVEEGNKKDNEVENNQGRRSWVWQHFTFVKGAVSLNCPYCKTTLKCDTRKNGTGSLANHLKLVCRKSPVYSKNKETKKQSLLGFKPTSTGDSGVASYYFSQEKCRRALARMCIKDNRPFSIVDDEGFREYSWEMNPLFKIPSRWTVARDCLEIYKEEACVIRDLLKNQTISITTDTWSSVQNINYMCLTAHWVDDNWVLKKKILNFCPIANHKGETIGKMVYGCLQKWGIERVFTVTVDNASSNDGAIRYLKAMLRGPDAILDCKYLHLRCCAHIVNLVVRDGLEEHQSSITKIRNAVRYVRSSPAREASFRESVKGAKVECTKKLCLDVDTRWNSTYLMLQIAEKYVDAFERFELVDLKYLSYFTGDEEIESEGNTRKRRRREGVMGPPNAEDWEIAREFIEYWKINASKFPVLSQVARHVLGMPISTVASESAFSTGGRVIDPFRSSLTPKTAEALICAQDWIRSSPADLELPDVNAKAVEELQEKLERIEADEFSSGPKFFAPCMLEE